MRLLNITTRAGSARSAVYKRIAQADEILAGVEEEAFFLFKQGTPYPIRFDSNYIELDTTQVQSKIFKIVDILKFWNKND